MSLSLYDISDRIEYILATCVEEDGTMTENTADMLDDLEDEREQKLLHIMLYHKGELIEGEAVKAEADKLARRAKIHLERAAWLKDYAARHLTQPTEGKQGEVLKDPRLKQGWRKGTSVEVVDESLIPREFIVVHTEERIDKMLAKQFMTDGRKVPGLALATKYNLQIK